jgi:uncharacterized protein
MFHRLSLHRSASCSHDFERGDRMTVELRPLNVHCNIQCQYCYQNPQRDVDELPRAYDMDKMKAAIEREGGPFSLFGGEPLLIPEQDLEQLWSWGYARYGSNSIQTNATVINDAHVRMFKDYNVHIGISVDGPGELNDARWNGSLERTREATAQTEAAIARLCAEGLSPSLIITLHRCNATEERLPLLCDWIRELDRLGVPSARLHLLEVESEVIRQKYALTVEENIRALFVFAQLETELKRLRFDLFSDMRHMLTGQDERSTCTWNACDPYTTRAVRGIEGDGQRSNCGRANKDGINFVKASIPGFERYLALYATPQEAGGCRDCRFFLMCKGHCPGTAIDGDWRNRTEHCDVWKAMYALLESALRVAGETPLSLSPLRSEIEHRLLVAWTRGEPRTIAGIVRELQTASGAS